MVSGGKQRSEGPLSMKRELREVSRQMAELERAMSEGIARVASLGREITEMVALLDRLEERTPRIRKARHDQRPHSAPT